MTENPYIKILVWSIPVVFGAGGFYAAAQGTSDKVAAIEGRVKESEKLLSDHTIKGVAHSGTRARLDQFEKNQQQILERQQRAVSNIAAICQATGAQCR